MFTCTMFHIYDIVSIDLRDKINNTCSKVFIPKIIHKSKIFTERIGYRNYTEKESGARFYRLLSLVNNSINSLRYSPVPIDNAGGMMNG